MPRIVTATGGGGGGGSPAPWPAADWYAAPAGSSSNAGTPASPWSLTYVLSGAGGQIQPGDVVEMAGGTYTGNYTCNLVGTAAAPIVVRGAWRQRVTIDGTLQCAPASSAGEYTWFWGLEVMRSVSSQTTPGINSWARGYRFINMIIHDHSSNGLGMWSEGPDQEAYGNIVYNNGYYGQDVTHAAHGIYSQNLSGYKHIWDNILFDNYGFGVHVYGTEAVYLNGFTVRGNAGVNNGRGNAVGLSGGDNWLMSGGNPTTDFVFDHNYSWLTAGASDTGGRFGDNFSIVDNQNGVFTDNVFMGNMLVCYWISMTWQRNTQITNDDYFLTELFRRSGQSAPSGTWDNNRYFNPGTTTTPWLLIDSTGTSEGSVDFAGWKSTSGKDASSTYSAASPTANEIYVRPNAYEVGRANVYVYNWQNLASVAVDLSGVLAAGDTYEVLDAQDFFGTPASTGTYAGGSITVPIAAKTPPASVSGMGTMPSTGTKFKAFVVRRTGAAA
jgi:hypothetical protein